jgi:hypothetical protein
MTFRLAGDVEGVPPEADRATPVVVAAAAEATGIPRIHNRMRLARDRP